MSRRPQMSSGRQRHGHKRKGKPVEAWMMDLERAEEFQEMGAQSLNLNAIERIADGVEQMVFSWDLDTVQRGQEYAKMFESLTTTESHMLPRARLERDDGGDPVSGRGCDTPARAPTPEPHVLEQQRDTRTHGRSVVYHMDSLHAISNGAFVKQRNENLHSESSTADGRRLARPLKHDNKRSFHPLQAVYKSCNWLTSSRADTKGTVIETKQFEDPGCPGVTFHQDRFSGATVLEVRRDHGRSFRISTSDQNCAPEGRKRERPQSGNRDMLDTTLQLIFGGQLLSVDGQTAPATPGQRNSSHMKQQRTQKSHDVYVAERQIQLSPPKDQPRMQNASTLTHASTIRAHSPQRVDGFTGTRGELMKRSAAHADSSKYDLAEAGADAGYSQHCVSDPGCYPSNGRERPTETLEVGGHAITVPALRNSTQVLENKFQSLINLTPGVPLIQEKEHQCVVPPGPSDVEELQIALLECAMEYEIKTIETKMKLQELNTQSRQLENCKSEQPCLIENSAEMLTSAAKKLEFQSLQQVRKQMIRLQDEKETLQGDLTSLRNKERQFERQRRSLDDALNRVDRLQREVVKKEREVTEWQLREKETKAQLLDLEDKLERAQFLQASQRMEPRKLLTLLPALREWLRSLKTETEDVHTLVAREYEIEASENYTQVLLNNVDQDVKTKGLDQLRSKRVAKIISEVLMAADRAGIVPHQNHMNHEDQRSDRTRWASVKLLDVGSPEWTATKGNKNLRELFCSDGMRKPVRDLKGGTSPEYICSKSSKGVSCKRPWDVNCNPVLGSVSGPGDDQPLRLSGGTGCKCSCPPTNRSPCATTRPVESCLPGLHQTYKDFYPECGESHLPSGYRRFVEHDDLYLPASRPLSPASTDHDDLYLPLSRPCSPPSPRPAHPTWCAPTPAPCAPPGPKLCTCSKPSPSTSTYLGDIYLPPSRPCTPNFPKNDDPCFQPPSRECFGLGGMATEQDNMPCFKPSGGGYSEYSCKPSPPKCQFDDPYLPSSRPLTPMSVEPIDLYLPSSPSCSRSCSPAPSWSLPPSRCPSPTNSVYIDEVPSPPCGDRYISCKDCLCHKAESTRSLCPQPPPRSPGKNSPCRDCVCHLGARSPSQRGGTGRQSPPKPATTRCNPGFQTPAKPRGKKCQECKSPWSCKGPPQCNPQYIVETPISASPPRSRSPSPGPKGNCSAGVADLMSPRCRACDCHKKGGSNAGKKSRSCSPPKFRPPSPCYPSPPPPCPPFRVPFAAELLSAEEDCYYRVVPSPTKCAAPPKPAPGWDPRCATGECHEAKSPCRPPSPPPCGACPPPSPPKMECPGTPSFKYPSPSCATCDCHKLQKCKQFTCSTQIKSPLSRSPVCSDSDCHEKQQPNTVKWTPDSSPCKERTGRSCSPPAADPGPRCAEFEVYLPKDTPPCNSPKCEPRFEPKFRTEDSCREVEGPLSPRVVAPQVPEKKYPCGPEQSVSKAAEVESQSPRYSRREPSSWVQRTPSSREVTRRCCCGPRECTNPGCLITTICPFCTHVHSCCCGMCSCPNPTCSSKSPIQDTIVLARTPAPCSPKSSSGGLRGSPGYYSRSKSPSPMMFTKPVSNASSSPVRVAPRSNSPSPKCKLQLLEPKVRHPSPRTQSKSNNYTNSQPLRTTTPDRRCSQRQSPTRRSQVP